MKTRHLAAGFTLLETMLAVTVFMLIVGMMAIAFQGAASFAATFQETETRRSSVDRGLEVLSDAVGGIGPQVQINVLPNETGDMIRGLRFSESPLIFDGLETQMHAVATDIIVRRNTEGEFELVMRYLRSPDAAAVEPASTELVLLRRLFDFEWEFFEPGEAIWQEEMLPGGRPELIRWKARLIEAPEVVLERTAWIPAPKT